MHTWWMLLERDETQTNSIALSVADVSKRPKCLLMVFGMVSERL